MKKIYLLFLSAIISAGAFAQFVPVIVNPGTSPNIVFGGSNYHVSESIYLADEVGTNNYITAGSAIQAIYFFLEAAPSPGIANNFKISMKNIPAATTTLATGVYSAAGYTVVFNGTVDASAAGLVQVILTTPFQRVAGNNLQLLIERTNNIVHFNGVDNNIWDASVGNINSAAALSTRRYNNTTAPTAGITSLTASTFRPAIAFDHVFAIDAIVNDIIFPTSSCFNTPQSVSVEILNGGTTNIAVGAASTTLRIRGGNTFTGTLTNTGVILPGASEFITFTGVNLSNAGNNFDTAYVNLAGDGTRYYDTLTTITGRAEVLSTYPLVEDVETTLPVFPYVETIALGNLWTLQNGDYTNADQTTALVARAPGTWSYLFDSYSGASSLGFESRLFSNCIDLSSATAALLTFWMSHDNVFPTDLDSMYVSVSTDRGVTWNRLQGFRRPDATAVTPVWRQESINLAAFLGQTIQIGFEGVSKYGNAFSLDDITIAATLPVSILNFDAQRNGKVNELNWRTAQEIGSSRFIVERSTDGGRNYAEIGQVAAAGNSSTERSYSFTDISPVKGFNYYRLRIVDNNNSFKYSIVRNVKNTGSADFSIAPNPVQQQIAIKLDADNADKGFINITDMSGKQVYSSPVNVVSGSNSVYIDASTFAQGSYIIKIQLSNDRIVKKFTKL